MFWFSVIGKESSLCSEGLLGNDNQSMAGGTIRRLTESTFDPNKNANVNVPQERYTGTIGICLSMLKVKP